ncbi:MAG: hypothetical protein GXO69_06825 [Acidobacteria bacterium]|nr:hypothetical protein [Acidobacteriota bacterium]
MKKKIVIALIAVLAVLVIVPVISYFSLKNRDLRAWVTNRIESSTDISVSMDSYELRFPAKILVHKLKLKTPAGISVSADKVAVHPSILKLVTGKLYLKSVFIGGADIFIPLDNTKEETAPEKERHTGNTTGPQYGETTALPLGNLEIRNAALHIMRGGKETKISGIQLSFSPGSGFRLIMFPGDSANKLKLTGTLKNNKPESITGILEISKVQPLLKLLPKGDIPFEKLSGTAAFSLRNSGNSFSFRGNFNFPALSVNLDKEILSYPMKGKFSGTASADGSHIQLNPSTLTVRSSTFSMSGKLLPNATLSFSGKNLSLQKLTELIPPSQSPFPEGTAFTGNINLSGSAGSNGVSADLLLKNDKISISGMDPLELAGKLHLTEKQIQITGLLLNNPRTDLNISGTIDNYLSDHGSTNLKILGKMLNFAQKSEKKDKKSPKSHKNNSNSKKTTENKPIPISYPDFEGMTHHISCAIGSVFLPGLTLSNLKVQLIAGDKGTFLKKCSGKTLGGTFAVTGKLLPAGKGIKFSGKGQGRRLKLTGILSDKLPVTGGRLSTVFSLSGNGTDSEVIKQNINGMVKFNVSDAVLRDTPALEKVEELTGMKFIGKKMSRFDGEAKIRNGKAEISNTRMSAAGIRADFSGTVSLDGKLNVKVPVQISGEAGKKLPAKLRFMESDGKVTLPLEIKGEIQKPKVKIDMRNAEKEIRKKLKKKLLNRLFGN